MKKLVILVLSFSALQCFAQDIDPRLMANKGEAAHKAYTYNKNSYNYMLFELDSSYVVMKKADLTKEEKSKVVKNHTIPASAEAAIGTPSFNLFSYGVKISKTERQYFELSDKTILVVLSTPEISNAFRTSSLNTK